MLAVGEVLWGGVEEETRRISSVFSGGLGSTHSELCGALSGGAIVIGVQHGRASAQEDNTRCKALTARYRQDFQAAFGHTICADLRASGYGGGGTPCSALVARAVEVLLPLLEAEEAGPA